MNTPAASKINIAAILWGLLMGGLIALSSVFVPLEYAAFVAFFALLLIMALIGPVFDAWDWGFEYFRRKNVTVWPSESSLDTVDRWNKTLIQENMHGQETSAA